MTEIDLGAFASLVQAEKSADDSRRFHEAEAKQYERVRDQIREQLAKVMGNAEVGIINGKEVLKKTSSKSFAWARFRDENPDIAPEYTVSKLVDEIDKERLAKELPNLYARYCTTRWTNNSEVL
jgi:uncharacterized protein YabN with tetrapyrrole methylase and pyrophosphatase domain